MTGVGGGGGMFFYPFWSEIGFAFCTRVLNEVCFLEEVTSSSSGDKAIKQKPFSNCCANRETAEIGYLILV